MQAWFSRVASSATGRRRGAGADGGSSGGSGGGGGDSPRSRGPLGLRSAASGMGGVGGGGYQKELQQPLTPEEVARGQRITRVAEELVREIQRILRSAKEAQHRLATQHQQRQQQSPQEQHPQHQQHSPSRWAGTDELLALLSSAPGAAAATTTTGAGEGGDAEGEAEAGTPPVVLGTLEALMDHPQFVSRCLEAALPPNLGHCLRLMRVIELEAASEAAAEAAEAGGSPDAPLPPPLEPLTVEATARIARVLGRLCQEGAVVEQLRHHLEGLLKLSTASYPPSGVHVQRAAVGVVEAMAGGALSSSLVWFIHDRQIVMQMADDLFELCGIAPGQAAPGDGEDGGPGASPMDRMDSLADCLLYGPRAEAVGLWLAAAASVVALAVGSARFSTALLADFQEARGYEALRYMVRHSHPDRRPELLHRLAALVGAGAETNAERGGGLGGAVSPTEAAGALGTPARNFAAFEVIRDVLVEATPILRALAAPDPVRLPLALSLVVVRLRSTVALIEPMLTEAPFQTT